MSIPESATKTGTPDVYNLDTVSETSTSQHHSSYRDSFDDDDEVPDYLLERSRQSFVGKVLAALGMSARRRKQSIDYFSSESLRKGLFKASSRRSPPREMRRCRRSYVGGCLRKAIFVLPALALMLLGVFHLIQVVVGRARLFWDVDEYDEFLPDWGKPGYAGDGLVKYPTDATRDVIPIPCHSHNDYWRRVPLFDAIHWGCTGVEADVWLFDEELYVGHNTASLSKNRTFTSMYVDPLVELLEKMNPNTTFANATGHGVFDEDPSQTLVLLVDFKTSGRDTFPFVQRQLQALREKNYLTYWDGSELHQRAVTVVGTGNTPFDTIVAETSHRDIFFDAPIDKMWETPGKERSETDENNLSTLRPADGSGQGNVGTGLVKSADDFNATNSYYASVSFTKTVGFVWRGHLSSKQMDIIRGQIRGAKRRGLKARYWDTPSWPRHKRNYVWRVLIEEGADVLNVDDLKGAAVENWKARVHGFW